MDEKRELTAFQQCRVAQAQKVLLLLFLEPDLTIEGACSQVGISKKQYQYWLGSGDRAIEETRLLIEQHQRVLISELAIAKTAMFLWCF